MARDLPGLIEGRYGGWARMALRPGSVFAAGGAIRAAAELALGHSLSWEPKDLDLFALDEEGVRRTLALADLQSSGVRVDSSQAPMHAMTNADGLKVDLVLYDLGCSAEAALSTFDFSVNALGWDGERVLFPGGRMEDVMGDIDRRVTRVQTGHVFLRRPVRALKRLSSIMAKGYAIYPQDLRLYAENFAGPGRKGPPG
jgi:hypothetical protein